MFVGRLGRIYLGLWNPKDFFVDTTVDNGAQVYTVWSMYVHGP